jgi:hypothetical protein
MDVGEPITESEFRLLLAENVLRLDAVTFERWERLGVMPAHVQCERDDPRGGPSALEPLFVVARVGDEVLIYDDVGEEFGVGCLDADGVLRQWATYGEELRWAIQRFPSRIDEPTV